MHQDANSHQTITKQIYAECSFDVKISTKSESSFATLLGPVFAMHKLEQQIAKNTHILHLNALLQERIGSFEKAIEDLSSVCDLYEELYEKTEADEDLFKFVQAKADLSRSYLAMKKYAEAIESASAAIDLSGDFQELASTRLSAHLTSGLAYYFSEDMDTAVEMFKVALEESSENPDVITLLAQVLWAKGGNDEKDVAREQLIAW